MQDFSLRPSRVEDGNYRADVLRGGTVDPFWYYVIRRMDSNEAISIAKYETYEKTLEAAREALARMNLKAG
jgi:hypothetical protein